MVLSLCLQSREFHSVDTIEKVFIVAYTATLLGALGVTVYKLATITYTNPDFPFALVLLCSICKILPHLEIDVSFRD